MTTYYNEMVDGGVVREPYAMLSDWVETMPAEIRQMKQAEAEALFRRIGITFAVYGEGGDPDRLIPFDMMPRVFLQSEWRKLERGIKQRARALNAFLRDVYGRGEIVRAGRIPARLVYQNEAYEKAVVGFVPPRGVYSHIVGIDIVRTGRDEFYVLEDNCRTPSGVSYMLENREIMMRMFPALFRNSRIEPVDQYPEMLRRTLASVAPAKCEGTPTVVILTPGHYNSAYYEHSFPGQPDGGRTGRGQRSVRRQGLCLYAHHAGAQARRRDLSPHRRCLHRPLCFRPDSMLGVPGLMDVYRSGGVSICSAPGAGVADDKAIYTFVPEMVRFYLGEEPILNNVQTWTLWKDDDYKYVMANLKDLVVKEVHGSGGYGMLVGPKSTKEEIEDFRKKIEADPGNYIAQPTLALSTCPTFVDEKASRRAMSICGPIACAATGSNWCRAG
jgi:uncharacterized circularly permuted ATP-grasp superfamily protein